MGLRDRGFVLDYYIPLFSGVGEAGRSRFRVQFPSAMYNPYIDNGGTGSGGGGLGGGGGGFTTPLDASIAVPSITSPPLLGTGVCPQDSITSSAFDSSNGQTHVATRWWIESANPSDPSVGAGIFVLDSGPDTVNLTSLPFAAIGLAPGVSYRVFVRYKGSDGGWSDFSLASPFTMQVCGLCDTFILGQSTAYQTSCETADLATADFIASFNAATQPLWQAPYPTGDHSFAMSREQACQLAAANYTANPLTSGFHAGFNRVTTTGGSGGIGQCFYDVISNSDNTVSTTNSIDFTGSSTIGGFAMAAGYPTAAVGATPPKAKLSKTESGTTYTSDEYSYTAC